MSLSNAKLLAVGATAALISAAGTLALDRAGLINISTVIEARNAPLVAAANAAVARAPEPFVLKAFEAAASLPPSPSVDRLAYVPLSAAAFLAMSTPELVEPVTAAAIEPQVPDNWTAEAHRETAPTTLGPLLIEPPRRAKPKAPLSRSLVRDYTLAKRLAQISPAAMKRLEARFLAAKAAWPPEELALVAIKDEKILELYGRLKGGQWTFIHRYPVLAASGKSGPKLRQGDKQVPEGIYGISFLNPNSRYHVSMRVNYPNAFDRQMAAADGRSDLGGDIMIHGKAVSVGCIAVGDEAAEELFVLAAETGLPKIKLIIAPSDFRKKGVPAIESDQPKWLPGLYTEVASAMAEFKAPPPPIGLLSFFSKL